MMFEKTSTGLGETLPGQRVYLTPEQEAAEEAAHQERLAAERAAQAKARAEDKLGFVDGLRIWPELFSKKVWGMEVLAIPYALQDPNRSTTFKLGVLAPPLLAAGLIVYWVTKR